MNDVSGHGFDHFAHENSIYTIYEKNNALKQYGKDLIKWLKIGPFGLSFLWIQNLA